VVVGVSLIIVGGGLQDTEKHESSQSATPFLLASKKKGVRETHVIGVELEHACGACDEVLPVDNISGGWRGAHLG
jgi:hypothetical protein